LRVAASDPVDEIAVGFVVYVLGVEIDDRVGAEDHLGDEVPTLFLESPSFIDVDLLPLGIPDLHPIPRGQIELLELEDQVFRTGIGERVRPHRPRVDITGGGIRVRRFQHHVREVLADHQRLLGDGARDQKKAETDED